MADGVGVGGVGIGGVVHVMQVQDVWVSGCDHWTEDVWAVERTMVGCGVGVGGVDGWRRKGAGCAGGLT